jgi:protocatechuate 3,4-dioxygenase beta subunit
MKVASHAQRARRLATRAALLAALLAPLPVAGSANGSATPDEQDGRRIRGRVFDEAGEPVAAATVRVLRRGLSHDRQDTQPEAWIDPIVVATGEDGTFVTGDLTGLAFTIRAEAPHRAPASELDVAPGVSLDLHLGSGHTVQGSVLDANAGRPVVGAHVLACDATSLAFGPDSCARTVSDADGAFALSGLPAGELQLRAHAAGYAVSAVRALDVPAVDHDATLRMQPGARVSGVVVDERDRPVPSARVYIRAVAGSGAELDRRDDAWPSHTGAQGSFVLDGIPAGASFGIFAYRADRGSSQGGAVSVGPGEDVEDVRIRLPSPAVLALRLVDENDDPVGDFVLYCRQSEQGDGRWSSVPLDRVDRASDGGFTVPFKASGTFDLRIAPEGFTELARSRIELAPGRTTDLGTLVATEGLSLRGRVTDANGEPVAHATVEATWDDPVSRHSRRILTDREGRYDLTGLDDLPVRVEASAEGFVSAVLDEILPGRTDVDLTLHPAGGLAGRVELQDGGVPDGFLIVVHVEAESSAEARESADYPRKDSFATEGGGYRIDDVPPGRYTVEARASGHAPGRRTGIRVAEGRTTDVPTIELERGLELEGRVVTLEDESPVRAAQVTARKAGGSLLSGSSHKHAASTDDDGRFLLEGLEAGPHVVRARHPEFAPAETTVEVAPEAEPPETVLRLSRGGTLTGVVRDATGEPAPGRRVLLRRDLVSEDDFNYATTDVDGRYELTRLAPGSYVAGLGPGRGNALRANFKNAVIREGGVTVLDFDEASRITLTGTVYRDGEPLGHAWLFLARTLSLTDFKFAVTDASGHYEVGLDEPGTYRVLLESDASGGASTEIAVADRELVQQDIHLGSEDGVVGTVTDADGRPIADAVVAATPLAAASNEQAAFLVAETGTDGRFTIEGFPPGAYRVTASAPGFRIAAHAVEITGGSDVTVVDFRLDRGGDLRGRLVDELGHGIAGAAVLAAPAGSTDSWGTGAATATTDVNGSFRLTTPVEGPIDLTALPSGWAPARLVGVVPPDGDGELVLRAGRGGNLRIQVVDPEGLPRPGVGVAVRPDPPFLGSDLVQLLTPVPATDAAGVTALRHLAPGPYRIRVNGRADAPPTSVTIQEGAESLVLIELP